MPDSKPESPQPSASCACEGTLMALALDRRRGMAFVAGSAGCVYLLDLNAVAWKLEEKIKLDGYVSSMALLDRGAFEVQLVVGRYDGSLTWYDPHDGRLLKRIEQAHAGWLRDLVVTTDGTHLVTVGDDMLTKVWDAQQGTPIATFSGQAAETSQGYVSALYAVAASADGRFVASADRVGEIRVWDVQERREAGRMHAPELYTFDPEKRDRSIGGPRRLRFSPDGCALAVAGIGQISNVDGFVGPGRVEVWDWKAGKRIAALGDPHQAVFNDVLWSNDGQRLVAAGGGDGGGLLALWGLPDEKPVKKIKFKGHVHRLAWLSGNEQLLAVGHGGVQLWKLE